MTKDISFSLDEQSSAFVETQVSQGRYASAGDVLRAGLQLLEERERELDALRAALIEGEKGPFIDFDIEEFLGQMRADNPDLG